MLSSFVTLTFQACLLYTSRPSSAALTEAKGRRATFPSWLPWPRLILDHILFTAGLTASDVRSFTAVSYTHLDVYKRQVQLRAKSVMGKEGI